MPQRHRSRCTALRPGHPISSDLPLPPPPPTPVSPGSTGSNLRSPDGTVLCRQRVGHGFRRVLSACDVLWILQLSRNQRRSIWHCENSRPGRRGGLAAAPDGLPGKGNKYILWLEPSLKSLEMPAGVGGCPDASHRKRRF